MSKKRGLGRGLGALIPVDERPSGLREVPVSAIVPNPHQPRQALDEESLQELAASIREHGLIQPLIVSEIPPKEGGDPLSAEPRYQLIAGERRWEAAKRAGLEMVPVLVREATPQQMLELALVENIQRADLNPLEEALAYRSLMDDFGLTQAEVAERVGKSRVTVANIVRLLNLPDFVKEALAAGQISEGHARALLALEDEAMQQRALTAIIKRHLSVRQTEELVRRLLREVSTQEKKARTRSPETEALEAAFREALGTKVQLFRSKKGGKLVIHFYSEEELQAIYDVIVGRG